jgi:hypothetical protein
MDRVTERRLAKEARLRMIEPYYGQNIAWSMDQKEILGHAVELSDLFADMNRRGIKDYMVEYLPELFEPLSSDNTATSPGAKQIGSANGQVGADS